MPRSCLSSIREACWTLRENLTATGVSDLRSNWTGRLATVILAVVLATLASTSGLAEQNAPNDAATEKEASKPVVLTIDYGDGFQKRYTRIPSRDDMTVLDAMQSAAKHRRGFKFRFRGSGATALLTQIDDLTNEGAGRNWIYRVNDKLGDRSFAIYSIRPGDRILWRFDTYEP